MSYWYRVLVAVTQALNALLGGWPDESFSSRAWRQREDAAWLMAVLFIDFLFFWQDDHCAKAYESETKLRQMPPELRERS